MYNSTEDEHFQAHIDEQVFRFNHALRRQYRVDLTRLVHDLFRRMSCPLQLRESPGPVPVPSGLSSLVAQDLGAGQEHSHGQSYLKSGR